MNNLRKFLWWIILTIHELHCTRVHDDPNAYRITQYDDDTTFVKHEPCGKWWIR